MAERMSLLYELHSPEFFERSQFGVFIGQLRARKVVSANAEGKLVYEPAVLEAIASDAQLVLHEQIRHSILQVVHR
jgi:glycerol-3-phosphate O-acyltransferase